MVRAQRKKAKANAAKEKLSKALAFDGNGHNIIELEKGLDSVFHHMKTVNDAGFDKVDMLARSIGESQLVE